MTGDSDRLGEDYSDELQESLSEAIDPLDSVAPDADLDDLDAVGEAVAGANVIGMGEASHGTREFFQFKHRLFRYLVEEQSVRMLGLEANFAAVLEINDYVMGGAGTAEDALSQNGIHRCYRTESIRGLIEWVRAFNDGRELDEKVRFHGIDVQNASVAAATLESYVETVDPEMLEDVRTDLDKLADRGIPDFSEESHLRAHLEARQTVVSTLGEALDDHETAYVNGTSRREYETARRLVWMIEQGRKQFEAIRQGRSESGANIRIRDSAMAAQIQWLLGREPADQIALWGHNAHLARGTYGGGGVRNRRGIPSLGRNLAGIGGIDYYALGLTLRCGTVSAIHVPEREPRAYEIEEPPEGSIPAVFGRVEDHSFFLDLATLPADSALGEWLDTRPPQYDIVGGYEDSPVNLVESDFRAQFDGLVFVRETTASRPLSSN